MKKKIPRMVAFLLALVLTAGIATPASAAADTYITVNGEVYNAGNLIYDYDQVPAYMKYNWGMASSGLAFFQTLEMIKTERADALSVFMVRVSRFELEAS